MGTTETREPSRIPFRRASNAAAIAALAHARVAGTSKTYGWQGLYAEVGENDGWSVDGLIVAGHYVAINRDRVNLDFEYLDGQRWAPVSMPPRSLWIQPAALPFSFRVRMTARWCGIVLDPDAVTAILGRPPAIEPAIGLEDPVLAALLEAIAAEVLRGGSSGARFAEAMLLAVATQLGRLFGTERQVRGGVAGRALRLVTDFVDAHLERELGVADLAAQVGLSTAHFARAFKESTGLTPQRFVMRRRLERARRFLADTELAIGDIAAACGFYDQAHLARLFKQRYGESPRDFRETLRR
jgi:AraC family transcriptional regulator